MADVAEQGRGGQGAHIRADRLLRPQEAADYLGLSLKTVYNLCSERVLPVVKIGRRSRFRLSTLEKYVRRNERRAIA